MTGYHWLVEVAVGPHVGDVVVDARRYPDTLDGLRTATIDATTPEDGRDKRFALMRDESHLYPESWLWLHRAAGRWWWGDGRLRGVGGVVARIVPKRHLQQLRRLNDEAVDSRA